MISAKRDCAIRISLPGVRMGAGQNRLIAAYEPATAPDRKDRDISKARIAMPKRTQRKESRSCGLFLVIRVNALAARMGWEPAARRSLL